jgi:eukaryotic-like serine/threonine-protein kinase
MVTPLSQTVAVYHFPVVAINSDRPEDRPPAPPAGPSGDESPAGTDLATASVDELVGQGKYGAAAELARSRGDALRAAELYERIWEFGLAADCAREAGDPGRALRNAIDSRDENRVHAITRSLDESGDQGRREAMEAFAQKRRFDQAAPYAEALGELDAAIEYYRSAHRELDAARLLEQAGRDREAGLLLERFIELGPGGDDLAQAQLRLGLLLSRRMNHEAATRCLQEAARHPATRARARRALIVALAAMDLFDSAREVLLAARADDPDLPADIDVFLRNERESGAAEHPAPAQDQAEESQAPQIIGGRYRLGALIGAGGAGRVFHARDEISGRECAVKLFYMAHARGNQAYERFVREARLASALRHPNLIEVHDFSADQGYLVMELMSGSLLERLASQPLSGAAARRMCLDVLSGLELAHQRGVIHRDIKPANIFFDARGTAKLGDFGVAHLLDLGHTQTGGLIGTLAYMSPEQITGAPLTITADLYSLGVTLFEALTGRSPFLGPDFVAQHLGDEPPLASSVHADIAPGWDAIIARLLAKSPDERYPAIEELRRAILNVDLGGADQPTVLILRRGASTPAATTPARAPASMPAQQPPGSAAEGSAAGEEQPRYQFETAIGRTDVSRLSRAVDSVLDRSVIIERHGEGVMDQAMEQRLYALARGGGPFLQRALSYDRDAGVAVFEAPSGTPIGEAFAAGPPSPRRAARLLKRLARAMAPLHENHNTHGALSESTILVDDDANPTILVCGLGRVTSDASPEADVRAILELVTRVVRAPRSGAGAARDLIAAIIVAPGPALGATDQADQAEILALADPATGEELYALGDAIETAMLRALRRSSSLSGHR